MTTSSSFSIIAKESQQGVVALKHGDFQGALRIYQQALRKIGAILWHPEQVEEDDTEMAGVVASACTVRSLPLSELAAPLGNGSGVVSIFRSALVFENSSPPSSLEEEPGQVATLSAVLCYNSALCYHLLGLETMEQSNVFLQKALQMYTNAFSLLSEMNDPGVAMQDSHVLISLALLNNMAHIHSTTMNLDRVYECLEAMQDISEALGGCLEADHPISSDVLFFSTTCLMIPRGSLVASPAA